jgi:predicted AlkP superfamily phosphohydrolase/phosphomutase
MQWDPDAMKIRRVSADWLYAEPFWYEWARNGNLITIFDVPMTFPSRLASAQMPAASRRNVEISNWGSHDQLGPFHSNDDAMGKLLLRKFGSHPMGPEIPVDKTSAQLATIHRNLLAGVALKIQVIRWLMSSSDWDLFVTVFGETHRGGHILWPEGQGSPVPDSALLEVYQAIDQALEETISALDLSTTRILIFSLHGMQANRSQEHFMPDLMDRINAAHQCRVGGKDIEAANQRSLMRFLRKNVSPRLQNAIARKVPVGVRDWVVSKASSSGYDWSRTPGLPLLADYNGYVRLNIKSRESSGLLNLGGEHYHDYVQLLQESFLSFEVCEDNAPLISEVVKIADVFPGTRSHLLPDYVVTWKPQKPVTRIRSEQYGSVEGHIDTGRSGNHRHVGFAILLGPLDEGDEEAWREVNHIQDISRFIDRFRPMNRSKV